MSIFQKLAKTFSDDKSTPTSSSAGDDRDQVIRGTKKTTRLINDNDWIRNKPSSDESQNMSADVNYGKSALSRVKSEEGLNSDPTSKLRPTTKSDTIDGRRSGTADPSKTQRSSTLDRPARDSGSTNVTSPANKYSSLDRKNRNYSYKTEETPTISTDPTSKSGFGETSPKRTSPYKTDELPKMTIITSETKIGSPTNKSLLSRPSPDGQVTTQEKSPTKPILKWGSQNDETSGSGNTPKTSTLERYTAKTPTMTEAETLIDLTPTTEDKRKRTSDFTSKVGSKSLIDLSITPEKPTKKTPAPTPTTPARTSSLVDLSPSIPDKPKRNSGEWDNTSSTTTTSTKTTFNPNSRSSRNSGDWDNTNSYTTTTTKSTFDPRSSGEWENTSSYTTISTKTSPDNVLKSTRSTSEHALLNDEPSTYKSPTSYTKTSSSGSLHDKSPVTEEHLYNSRSSYKENSPPSEQLSDSDSEPSVYRSPSYSLQKNRNSSSSLSDGKGPSKVITITKGFSSAEQKAMDKNVCSQCYKPINKGAKMILEDMNINCHAACFKCQICNSSLENLNAGDNFWVHHRTVHCEPCYDKVKAQWKY